MRTKLFILASCSLLLLAAGCKKDKDKEPETTLTGNVSRPTTWTVSEDYDYTSSMTAVIKVANINGQIVNEQIVNENDLLSAFVGDNCVGVVSPDTQTGLFFIYISAPNEQMVNEQMVNLKYYSVHYKNIFEAENVFPFQNDAHLGTIAEPIIPTFISIK